MRAVAVLVWFAAVQSLSAGTISWSGNTWNHSGFGGSSASSGWQNGIWGGTTTDSGVTVSVQRFVFGNTNTNFPGSRDMTLESHLNPSGSGFGDYLQIHQTQDYTNNSNNPATNYGMLRIQFSQPVYVSNFGIQDVDDGTGFSWQDFMVTRARNGATNVGVTYTLGSNQQLLTRHGLNGVVGTGNINRDIDSNLSDVQVAFANQVTEISIYFMQGAQGPQGVSHWINFYNFTVNPVPEPSTFVLVGMAGVSLYLLRRRRRSST